MRRTDSASIALVLLIVAFLFAMFFLMGCAHRQKATAPAYGGIVRQAGEAGDVLDSAAKDGEAALDRNAKAVEIVNFLDGQTAKLLGGE